MSTPSIGKLERVPLRQVWEHEAYDFTQWLQENIDVLNTALDLNLVNVDREQAAGSFSIDLVAEDEGGGTVIIENQLEKSNHDHLGKLITYLTGMGAKAAVWIVSDPRPEHVAAIAWLNEGSSAAFYMVKVEAVRIGDSPAAPLFTLIGPAQRGLRHEAPGLPSIPAFAKGNLFGPRLDQIGDAVQDRLALVARHGHPGRKRGLGRLGRPVDIRRRAARHRRDQAFVDRRMRLEHPACTGHILAGDQVQDTLVAEPRQMAVKFRQLGCKVGHLASPGR